MRPTTLLPTLLAAGAVAACGSSASSNTAAKPDQMLAFAKCMRANGVPNFPDPGGNGNGGIVFQRRVGSGASMTVNGVSVSSPAFDKAMQTCRPKLPNGGHPPPLSASRKAAMLKFAQCMRAHGVPFPDPKFLSGGRVGFEAGAVGNSDAPAMQQAQTACAKFQGGGFKVAVP